MKQIDIDWSAAGRSVPESSHWDWENKSNVTRGSLNYPSFCISVNGETQGLMIAESGKPSYVDAQKGKPLLYVHFIEVAPWNQKALGFNPPKFLGVGSLLIRAAIEVSRDLGFKGRIGLHSLPQSEEWYEDRCHMTKLGKDASKQNLCYFEMTPDQARNFCA
ncbi:GNAT family N-acetyltransferase [Pseudomonas sp. WS 5071]|uniref:GNAT family N-acetyltransferase n=1 Tax=Pseudomonas sp. WS 5071 TaxID=2717479 RepID=UPI0014756494|nr:GNAT family N-acetyltransferase [Pseudomonas sp. WS 5071]NMY75633.1 GNAT family N-acetyltransferase [Pseudomonas sp. WS 5071]